MFKIRLLNWQVIPRLESEQVIVIIIFHFCFLFLSDVILWTDVQLAQLEVGSLYGGL